MHIRDNVLPCLHGSGCLGCTPGKEHSSQHRPVRPLQPFAGHHPSADAFGGHSLWHLVRPRLAQSTTRSPIGPKASSSSLHSARLFCPWPLRSFLFWWCGHACEHYHHCGPATGLEREYFIASSPFSFVLFAPPSSLTRCGTDPDLMGDTPLQGVLLHPVLNTRWPSQFFVVMVICVILSLLLSGFEQGYILPNLWGDPHALTHACAGSLRTPPSISRFPCSRDSCSILKASHGLYSHLRECFLMTQRRAIAPPVGTPGMLH